MSAWPPLHLIGINHRRVHLGIRERLARPRDEIAELLAGGNGVRRRGVILSTCNRFEVYWWGAQDWERWFGPAAEARGVSLTERALLRKSGEAAARHLFRVAAGLDSQVVGEREVLGQVRGAWDLARQARSTTPELNLIFGAALAAGRAVRRETFLGRHPASIGSVAVDVARDRLGGSLAGKEILVIGAGEAARGVVQALDGSGASLLVASRRTDRAARLAAGHRALPLDWVLLDRAVSSAEVIVAATAAPAFVLSASRLGPVVARRAAPLLVLDLGVPRNVEPAVAGLPGLDLLDLDDLRARDGLDRLPAVSALEAVRDLVDESVSRLLERLRSLTVATRLADLHRVGAALAEEEAGAVLGQLPTLSEAEQLLVRRMADRLVRRVLYPASKVVRGTAPGNGVNGSTPSPNGSRSAG